MKRFACPVNLLWLGKSQEYNLIAIIELDIVIGLQSGRNRRSNVCLDILRYIHDIAILTKDLGSGLQEL